MLSVSVTGRDELANAIRLVPHDRAAEIVLHRNTGVTIYRFNYPEAKFKTTRTNRKREVSEIIRRRLDAIAVRILRQPKELFE